MYSIGIDPGWKNLGFVIVQEIPDSHKVVPLYLKTLNPSTYESPEVFVEQQLLEAYVEVTKDDTFSKLTHLNIERYVAYADVKTAQTENITSLIGGIKMGFYSMNSDSNIWLYRAIDWKIPLAQMLSKNVGFNNPSVNLDKKFSVAAANELIEKSNEIKTDHEADALCLAAFPYVKKRFDKTRRTR